MWLRKNFFLRHTVVAKLWYYNGKRLQCTVLWTIYAVGLRKGCDFMIGEHRVISFGLTSMENQLLQKSLPLKDYELLDTDAHTDLIAISSSAIIIRAESLDDEAREMILDFYSEINGCTDESVFWIGEPRPPKNLQKWIKCYDSFDAFSENMKYHLLTAHRASKKAKEFSGQLADCLQILAAVRAKPYIKTAELAKMTEKPLRTVQRYMATIQATGEWLEYDYSKKGWYLQDGVSILFGDESKGV